MIYPRLPDRAHNCLQTMEMMMQDRFENHAGALDGPATHAFSVTPHDSNELPETTRALYVGGAGTISLVLVSGAEVTLANVASSSIIPLRATRIKATGTSATLIVGMV
jgi:seryl-tRNA synthetase